MHCTVNDGNVEMYIHIFSYKLSVNRNWTTYDRYMPMLNWEWVIRFLGNLKKKL